MKQDVAVTEVVDVVRCARALVFDFDGTLVDSNPIKWRAFELCFVDFPKHGSEILAYCLSHNHTPRGDKFQHVYEKILGLPYTPEIAAVLHKRFEAATTRQIIEAPEVPGAEQFLARARRRHRIALLSSTPQEILLHILAERGWRGYFETIQGAPVDKIDWLKGFREKRGLGEQDVVFFGDTSEDAKAASEAKCTFVAVGSDITEISIVYRIRNFVQLLS